MATKKKRRKFTAKSADRHELYQLSVQDVEAEIDFVDQTFEQLRGRKAVTLREDFCGTGNTSCEWVRRREDTRAVGLDIDEPTLEWGMEHNVAPLTDEQKARVSLQAKDVMKAGKDAKGMDAILAMNFSYWIFTTRESLLTYFKSVRESLGDDGLFFLDFYGGYEAMAEQKENRKLEGFTYVWEQAKYEPITGRYICKIHFKFPDGTKMKDAFVYDWRLWTLPEVRELLQEAGFGSITVYWEGADEETGEGNGEFEPVEEGEADPAFLAYIVCDK